MYVEMCEKHFAQTVSIEGLILYVDQQMFLFC